MDDDLALAQWIDEHGNGVTSWEAGFLDSVLKRLDQKQSITEKQRTTLQRICEQRCGGDSA